MIENLNLYHIPRSSEQTDTPTQFCDLIRWQTCLRDIYFSKEKIEFENKAIDSYHGKDAYRFLLEVASGLHSRIKGETEIFSQFKELIRKDLLDSEWSTHSRVWDKAVQDVKFLRSQYLKNNGHQTYSSLICDYAKKHDQLIFFGSGNLVRESLPLLTKYNGQIDIICRDLDKVKDLVKDYPSVSFSTFKQNKKAAISANSFLAIAAPIPTNELEKLIRQYGPFKNIIDFRATDEGASPQIKTQATYLSLEDVFQRIGDNQKKIKNKIELIEKEIIVKAQYWDSKLTNRPFGWDDLCA